MDLIYDPEYDHDGNVSNAGGISSSIINNSAYNCFTTAEQAMPDAGTHCICGHREMAQLEEKSNILEWNVKTSLAQELFGNRKEVKLKEWNIRNGTFLLKNRTLFIEAVHILNIFLVPVLLLLCIVFTAKGIIKKGIPWGQLYQKCPGELTATAIICGVVCFFSDTAALGTARNMLNAGNLLFLVIINSLFLFLVCLLRESILHLAKSETISPALVIVVIVLIVLEFFQFKNTPRYDSHLYYGSLVQAVNNFNLDLLTYIGAFISWKWIHGTALVLCPFEFLMPGEVTGVYISVMLKTVLTVIIMDRLLKAVFVKMSPVVSAIFSLILVLMPYQLGMFTYLCLDNLLVYFSVWLVYSYYKKTTS